jgi:hypothetical protein
MGLTIYATGHYSISSMIRPVYVIRPARPLPPFSQIAMLDLALGRTTGRVFEPPVIAIFGLGG